LHLGGERIDLARSRIGFREAIFKSDGFFLNGRRVFLRGLNRHQSWPFAGYAMGPGAQRQDAEILKRDLGCLVVRTSHYPQSRHFLDACDELGLLVFTELPGWQHIGNEEWKRNALYILNAS
jgi:beta-galactosidase